MSSATLPKDSLMASTRSAFFSTAPFTVMLFNVDGFETTTERSCWRGHLLTNKRQNNIFNFSNALRKKRLSSYTAPCLTCFSCSYELLSFMSTGQSVKNVRFVFRWKLIRIYYIMGKRKLAWQEMRSD
jgi:hypothetical protein